MNTKYILFISHLDQLGLWLVTLGSDNDLK